MQNQVCDVIAVVKGDNAIEIEIELKNAIGSIRWSIPEKPPIGAKISQKSPTQAELQPILSQISLPWQRGSVGEKCNWQHSMAHPRKPPIGAKISQKSPTQAELQPILSQISLPWQLGSVGGKCNWQHSMAHPRKPPYRRKNLAKISYTSRVIANFVPNFVAMATREGPG